jgi:hypothetical protein
VKQLNSSSRFGIPEARAYFHLNLSLFHHPAFFLARRVSPSKMPRSVVTALLRTSVGWPQQTLLTAVRCNAPLSRALHSSQYKAAVAHPITAHGPPPKAPSPIPDFSQPSEQQTDSKEIRREGESRPSIKKPKALKKRFWKDVDVQKKQGRNLPIMLGLYPFTSLTDAQEGITKFY